MINRKYYQQKGDLSDYDAANLPSAQSRENLQFLVERSIEFLDRVEVKRQDMWKALTKESLLGPGTVMEKLIGLESDLEYNIGYLLRLQQLLKEANLG
jgi:hypothetical protein